MWAVFKKELKTYFLSPIGYVLIGIFLAIYSVYFIFTTLQTGLVDLGNLYYVVASWGLILFVPVLTMRLFAEERKNGTEQLLLTSPKSITKIVLGKFFAAVAVVGITLIASIMYYIIVSFLGKPNFVTLLVTLAGFLLLFTAAISAGMVASSITENQAIAAIITIALFILPSFLANLNEIFVTVDLMSAYSKFPAGLVSIVDVVKLVSYTIMCLLITIIILKRRRATKGFVKTPITIALIVIIIAIYMGMNLFIESKKPNDIDFTKDKVYSLSEASKSIINSIDQEVEITLINMQKYSQSTIDFAYKYQNQNNKIKVKEINDVNSEPELVSKYNLTDETIAIIIKCGEKEKVLSSYDLSTTDYSTYERKDITEEALTNALLDVTITERPKIYYLTGHNFYTDDSVQLLMVNLMNEANDVETLDLLTKGKVPEDASVLIIASLKEDITELERDALIQYIKQGGKIAIFANPNVEKISMPNYQKVLDQYGVSISDGIMLEQNTNYMLPNAPYMILVETNSQSSIMNGFNMNINACLIDTGKLNFKSDEELEKLGVEVETILQTSNTAFYREDMSSLTGKKQDTDVEGSQIVGALLTKKIDDNTNAKLIIYANNVFITNMQVVLNTQYYTYPIDLYDNQDIALNSISYLAGRDDTITIRKNTETTPYIVTRGQQNIILTIIFVVPVLIIIVGFVVWIVRRRKK